LTRRRVDKEQAQPSAIAPSHREADHAIGCTMIDVRQPFNADALKQCPDAVESDCAYGEKLKLEQERAVIPEQT
jgi:hypothetical protein